MLRVSRDYHKKKKKTIDTDWAVSKVNLNRVKQFCPLLGFTISLEQFIPVFELW